MKQFSNILVIGLWPVSGLANLLPDRTRQYVTLAYVLLCIAAVLATGRFRFTRPSWHSGFVMGLVGLTGLAYLRGSQNVPDIVTTAAAMRVITLYGALCVLALVLTGTGASVRSVVVLTTLSIVALHVINVMLWLLGVENAISQDQYVRTFDSMFTFLGSRQVMPLGGGLSGSAIISALGGLSALTLLKWPPLSKRYVVSSLALAAAYGGGAVGIAVAGNRMAAVVFVVLSLTILLFDRLLTYRSMAIVITLLYLFPLLYLQAFPILDDRSGVEAITGLSRTGNASEILTLNNRLFIWQAVIEHFTAADAAIWLGYGSYGQVASGISREYAHFFEGGWASPERASPHSTALQALVDGGVMNLMCVLMILVFCFSKACAFRDRSIAAPLTMLILGFAALSAIESDLVSEGVVSSLFMFTVAFVSAAPTELSTREPERATARLRPLAVSPRGEHYPQEPTPSSSI